MHADVECEDESMSGGISNAMGITQGRILRKANINCRYREMFAFPEAIMENRISISFLKVSKLGGTL